MKKTRNYYIMSCILPGIIFFIWTWAAFNMMDGFLNFILMLVAGVVLIAFTIAMGIFAYSVAGRIVSPNILMFLSRLLAFMVVYLRFEKGCSLGEAMLKALTCVISFECIIFVFALSSLSVASGIIYFVIMSRSIVCQSCQNKFYAKDAQPKKITIGKRKNLKVLICPHCEVFSEKRVTNPFAVSAIISIVFVLLIGQSKLFVIPFFVLVVALLIWYTKLKNTAAKKDSIEH